MTEEREAGCPEYRSRVEDYLLEGPASTRVEPDLAEHLKSCRACREAVEESSLASEIVRGACQPCRIMRSSSRE